MGPVNSFSACEHNQISIRVMQAHDKVPIRLFDCTRPGAFANNVSRNSFGFPRCLI